MQDVSQFSTEQIVIWCANEREREKKKERERESTWKETKLSPGPHLNQVEFDPNTTDNVVAAMFSIVVVVLNNCQECGPIDISGQRSTNSLTPTAKTTVPPPPSRLTPNENERKTTVKK